MSASMPRATSRTADETSSKSDRRHETASSCPRRGNWRVSQPCLRSASNTGALVYASCQPTMSTWGRWVMERASDSAWAADSLRYWLKVTTPIVWVRLIWAALLRGGAGALGGRRGRRLDRGQLRAIMCRLGRRVTGGAEPP